MLRPGEDVIWNRHTPHQIFQFFLKNVKVWQIDWLTGRLTDRGTASKNQSPVWWILKFKSEKAWMLSPTFYSICFYCGERTQELFITIWKHTFKYIHRLCSNFNCKAVQKFVRPHCFSSRAVFQDVLQQKQQYHGIIILIQNHGIIILKSKI